MTGGQFKTFGCIQLWMSGYGAGFAVAALIFGYKWAALFLLVSVLMALLGLQNIRLAIHAARVLVLVWGVATTASAQIPVTDPAVLARVTLGVLLSQDELRKAKETFDILTKMAGKGPDQTRYRNPTLPALRHESGRYLYGGQLLHGLNAGDRVGELLMAHSYPLAPSLLAVAKLTPDQRRRAEAQLASIDIADSVGQRALHQVALARGFDAETAQAIQNLDDDIMNPRTALHYMTAVVDKLSGGALIGRRQQAVSNQLTSHIVEQLLVETKRRRDAEAEVINMELSRILHGHAAARMLTQGMTTDLKTWRLP